MLSESQLHQCSLLGSTISECRLRPLTLREVDLRLTALGQADLRNTVLAGLKLTEANLLQTDLRGGQLTGTLMFDVLVPAGPRQVTITSRRPQTRVQRCVS